MLDKLYGQDHDVDFGKQVDGLIKKKNQAKVDLVNSSSLLLQMGIKVLEGDRITAQPGLDVEKYIAQNYQEFAWEAQYRSGQTIHQFGDPDGDKHFGDIDQEQLMFFRWVSCFKDETDNRDQRVIVQLDFETGRFSFLNGFAPQETRNLSDEGFPQGADQSDVKPKLVMKMVKRNSETFSYPEGSRVETMKYNRYLIGWELPDKKIILCVEPNGFVHPWHIKEN